MLSEGAIHRIFIAPPLRQGEMRWQISTGSRMAIRKPWVTPQMNGAGEKRKFE